MGDGWKMVYLSDVAAVNELTVRPDVKTIRYIDISSVTTGRYPVPTIISMANAPSRARRVLREGDTVISAVRPNHRAYFYAKNVEENAICSTGFAVITPKKVDSRFLYYILTNDDYIEFLTRHATGAAYPAVSFETFENSVILLPSLSIQRRIAEILGALDDKIDCNRRINQTLEQMAMTLYKHWFVDFGPFETASSWTSELGRIPKGWEVKSIGEICTTQYGYTASAVSEPIGPRFLRITDMNKHLLVDWESVPFCKADTDALEKYCLSEGDILVSRMADPGKVIRADGIRENAVFASYLIRVKPRSSSLSLWLYYFLRSNVYQTFISNAESGTVQKNLNAKELTSPKVAVPPQDLLDKFNQKVLPIRCQQIANQKEINLLAHTRDYLIPKLLSGEVEVSMI